MVTFKKIRWKNFLATGNVFTEVQIENTGKTLIQGKNGAGKSQILDALTYVLYGKPHRKINLNSLINSINLGDVVVEIEFSSKGKDYLIRRGMKPKLFEIYEDGILLNQESSVRDDQKFLEENILNLSYKSFTQIVVIGNSTYVPFMQLNTTERRLFVEDVLGISIFSKMNQILKEKSSILKDDFNALEVELSKLKAEKETIERYIKKQEDNKKDKVDNLLRDIKKTKSAISLVDKNIETVNKNIAAEKLPEVDANKKAEIIGGLRQAESAKTEEEKKVVFYEKNKVCPTCQQNIGDKFKKGILGEAKEKLEKLTKAEEVLNKKLAEVNKKIKEFETIGERRRKLEKTLNDFERTKAIHENHIETLKKEIKNTMKDTQEVDLKELDRVESLLKKVTKEQEEILDKKNVYTTTGKLLKDDGIKTKIIQKYLPKINALINNHLNKLQFFAKFTLDEQFNETIDSRYRDTFSYNSFSEGEKMRINIAVLFAWREIAKSKNSTNCNLIIFDEIFDSSLDTNGIDDLFHILYEKEKDSNIFIISHKGDVVSDKFVNIITFEKHKEFSRIKP